MAGKLAFSRITIWYDSAEYNVIKIILIVVVYCSKALEGVMIK